MYKRQTLKYDTKESYSKDLLSTCKRLREVMPSNVWTMIKINNKTISICPSFNMRKFIGQGTISIDGGENQLAEILRHCRPMCTVACLNLMGDAYCEPRAARGDCETDPDWMVMRCRRACHACSNLGMLLCAVYS